jgi:predicted TIM-barrel fold metal-dependent hydrolase
MILTIYTDMISGYNPISWTASRPMNKENLRQEGPGVLVDIHTHVGEVGVHIGGEMLKDMVRAWGDKANLFGCTLEQHWEAMRGVDRAVVLAFAAPRVGMVVPNEYVATYCRQHPDKLIGFASVDPNQKGAPYELERAVKEMDLKGLKLGPIYQHFHPNSKEAYAVFEAADALKLPVLIHQGTTFVRDSPLEYARPALLDEVARRYPDLKLWIAHLGHPWAEEMAATIRKHPNLYADISALHPRPVQFYMALNICVEYGVADKLFLGSDYPIFNVEQTIAGLRGVNRIVEGSNFPRIPEAVIEGIIQRNPLAVLGLQ